MGELVKSVDFVEGRLVMVLNFWGSLVNLSILLPDAIKRKIAAEVV
jgi:hypothetical protein